MKKWDIEDLNRITQMKIESVTDAFVKNNKNTDEVKTNFNDIITNFKRQWL